MLALCGAHWPSNLQQQQQPHLTLRSCHYPLFCSASPTANYTPLFLSCGTSSFFVAPRLVISLTHSSLSASKQHLQPAASSTSHPTSHSFRAIQPVSAVLASTTQLSAIDSSTTRHASPPTWLSLQPAAAAAAPAFRCTATFAPRNQTSAIPAIYLPM